MVISGLDFAWTVQEGWSGITAMLNHWPGKGTQAPGCCWYLYERDDWIGIPFR